LLGWEGNEQKHLGIFGKLSAFAAGVEEQGRTSLHGHIVLWGSLLFYSSATTFFQR
jgi:hypothetical protein